MDVSLGGREKPEREEVIEPLVEPRPPRRDEVEKPEREVPIEQPEPVHA